VSLKPPAWNRFRDLQADAVIPIFSQVSSGFSVCHARLHGRRMQAKPAPKGASTLGGERLWHAARLVLATNLPPAKS
jgi:hypothetical protein